MHTISSKSVKPVTGEFYILEVVDTSYTNNSTRNTGNNILTETEKLNSLNSNNKEL